MNIVHNKVEILPQLTRHMQIEQAARVCYKSEDKAAVDEAGAEEFVNRLISSKHYAMLEHAPVYLVTNDKSVFDFFVTNAFSYACELPDPAKFNSAFKYYITTNYRVIVENDIKDVLQYETFITPFHNKMVTAKFTCSRGTANEIVRHRLFSFAQESTRFCNYTKDKFKNSCSFVIPTEYESEVPEDSLYYWDDDWCTEGIPTIAVSRSTKNYGAIDTLLTSYSEAETSYNKLIEEGVKPQIARDVLPLGTKTEIVVTGPMTEWNHFFELRCVANAHPDIQKLAKDLYKQMYGKEYGTEEIEPGDISENTVDSNVEQPGSAEKNS